MTAKTCTAIGFHPDELAGYTLAGQTYCPTHAITALPTGPGQTYDGWALAEGAVIASPEDTLDEIAWAFGIDRSDETSVDSQNFPTRLRVREVISPTDAEASGDDALPTTCALCHEPLVG